jgi:hypothetical protein
MFGSMAELEQDLAPIHEIIRMLLENEASVSAPALQMARGQNLSSVYQLLFQHM